MIVWRESGCCGVGRDATCGCYMRLDEESMGRYRRDLESQVAIGMNVRLVIGCEFNTSVGVNAKRASVCGKYGLGRMLDAGRDLIEWCKQHELQNVNNYMRHIKRRA